MSIIRFLCITLILFFSAASAWASSTWSAISVGDPYYEYLQDDRTDPVPPSHLAVNLGNREGEAQAGWWDVGGRMHLTWDSSQQGLMYIDSLLDKDFTVTSAGTASVNISVNGTLQVNADAAYNNQYAFYSFAEITHSLDTNYDMWWEDDFDTSGELNVAHSTTISWDFLPEDVGDTFSLSMWFETLASPWPSTSTIDISQGDSLEFISSFYNGVTIDSITGGIAPADGPALVPIPPTFWLFAPAIIAILGVRRKSNRLSANQRF
jgi:hypothetical protein